MELTRAVASFHALLCSVWAVSHHSSMSSTLLDPSGKPGHPPHACHHGNSWPRSLISRNACDVFSFRAAEGAVPVRALLSDGAPSAATLPSAASSLEARRPRECPTRIHARLPTLPARPLSETIFSVSIEEQSEPSAAGTGPGQTLRASVFTGAPRTSWTPGSRGKSTFSSKSDSKAN